MFRALEKGCILIEATHASMGRIQDAVNKYEARCTTTTDQCEGLVEQVRADVWRLTSVAMLKWELMCLDGLMSCRHFRLDYRCLVRGEQRT